MFNWNWWLIGIDLDKVKFLQDQGCEKVPYDPYAVGETLESFLKRKFPDVKYEEFVEIQINDEDIDLATNRRMRLERGSVVAVSKKRMSDCEDKLC